MSRSHTPGTPKPERLGFPRAVRIRLSREFARVRSQGHSAQGRLLRLSIALDPAGGETRFGLITPRRLGEAVTRNLVRRRLREICRLHRRLLPSGLLILVAAKPMASKASFQELREEWLILARRLSILSGSR